MSAAIAEQNFSFHGIQFCWVALEEEVVLGEVVALGEEVALGEGVLMGEGIAMVEGISRRGVDLGQGWL